jgi:two-component system response regulator
MRESPILLVEDNPDDEALTRRAFERSNVVNELDVVRDGQLALDYLFGNGSPAHKAPALILLDLKLPKIDGIEVLRQVKADPRTRHIPVVILTSSQQESDLVETYGLGANSYIIKPVDFEKFTEAIRLIGMYWLLTNHPPLAAAVPA